MTTPQRPPKEIMGRLNNIKIRMIRELSTIMAKGRGCGGGIVGKLKCSVKIPNFTATFECAKIVPPLPPHSNL